LSRFLGIALGWYEDIQTASWIAALAVAAWLLCVARWRQTMNQAACL
jgi:hypothetical protein